eukprot:g860.t1
MSYEPQAAEDELTALQKKAVELENFLSSDDEEAEIEEDVRETTSKKEKLNDFSCVIIINNIPKTSKVEGLKKKVLMKLLKQFGPVNRLEVPTKTKDGKEKTLGFAFVEYHTQLAAKKATEKLHKYKLDKKHQFVVTTYNDAKKVLEMDDEYVEPTEEDFRKSKGRFKIDPSQNLRHWLSDKFQRDQFVVRFGKETLVNWVENSVAPPTKEYDGAEVKSKGKSWCERYVAWSPKGTYLATFHQQGIALWGGKDWKKLNRFGHRDVEFVEFSPNENFMLTWNGATGKMNVEAIKLFDLKSGKCARAFPYTHIPSKDQWPNFKFSYDDKYFARVDKKQDVELISVFETSTCRLLDKKSIRASGVTSFSWSPSQNIIAYWTPEHGNIPARITLMELPSRTILRQKVLYSVEDCKMYWQPSGDFLCVQVTRHTKSKKSTFTNFEIFRMRDSNIPVETIRVNEEIKSFAWEKEGVRFAVAYGDKASKADVAFYTMDKKMNGNKLSLLHTHKDRACDALYWSPLGNFIVIAGQESPHNGIIEFYDCEQQDSLATHEHFMCTDIKWSPCGRIVSTSVCQGLFDAPSMRMSMQAGYRLYSFMGVQLHKEEQQEFYSFAWRPRPVSLLTEKMRKEVLSKSNMRKVRERYLRRDKLLKNSREALESKALIQLRDEFRSILSKRREENAKSRQERINLLRYDEEDEALYDIVVEEFVEVIDERVEIEK